MTCKNCKFVDFGGLDRIEALEAKCEMMAWAIARLASEISGSGKTRDYEAEDIDAGVV